MAFLWFPVSSSWGMPVSNILRSRWRTAFSWCPIGTRGDARNFYFEIALAHGTFIYPDSAGNGGPEAPEHVYTVKFTAEELWGAEAADPNGTVYFDVWEPYITLVTTTEKAA